MKMRAIVIFEWDEELANWDHYNPPPKTDEELFERAKSYALDDYSYFLETDIKSVEITRA